MGKHNFKICLGWGIPAKAKIPSQNAALMNSRRVLLIYYIYRLCSNIQYSPYHSLLVSRQTPEKISVPLSRTGLFWLTFCAIHPDPSGLSEIVYPLFFFFYFQGILREVGFSK